MCSGTQLLAPVNTMLCAAGYPRRNTRKQDILGCLTVRHAIVTRGHAARIDVHGGPRAMLPRAELSEPGGDALQALEQELLVRFSSLVRAIWRHALVIRSSREMHVL